MFTGPTANLNHARFPASAICGSTERDRIGPRRRPGNVLAAFVAGLALLTGFVAPLASAQSAQAAEARVCLDRSDMIDTLIGDYDEQLSEVRHIKGKGLVEFHVSPLYGTWTALLTKGNGISCVLAVGEGIDPAKIMVLAAGTRI